MKLFLKTVTGNQQETDVEGTTSIAEIKQRLENDYDLATLRLCFKGAVLEDAKTVADLNLSEGDTLVIAGKKRKIPKPVAVAAAASAPAVTPEAKEAEAPAAPAESAAKKPADPKGDAKTPAPVGETAAGQADETNKPEAGVAPVEAPATTTPAVPEAAPAAPAAPVSAAAPAAAPAPAAATHRDPTSGVDATLIDNLVAMGFEDRSQVALALRAAYMNPDRAVEYLCTGIPPSVLSDFAQPSVPAAAAHAPAPTRASHPTAPVTAAVQPVAASTDLRSLLWNNVLHFDQIKSVYQENSSTLPVIMTQIAEHYPQIYQLIEQRPEEFLTIMAERGQPASVTGPQGDDGATVPAAATGVPVELPASVVADLTAEDTAAVNQLVELGGGMWDVDAAMLVYMAVERNQEVAASLLFEHGGIPPELLDQIAMQLQGGQEGDDDNFDDDEDA
ncbi:UV excision repair protein RAD23 [Strigomonas culicis]|uniref:UV excision repair protein RAD23 n=1 Tax=Strigomonas culicis TaxID=28005 RepID=S9U423_9TRYP|nr:UV excision repair protein RAD23 [Strigomonas culicis]|eukprot:EPY25532.1 UV excision repair protein RAD23 [Strigomonas culicis]